MALIDSSGSVRTIELAESLDVSDETIRRDLERLEADGKLKRTHGGAIRVEKDLRELPFDEREGTHVTQKHAIAQLASQMIQPGDTLFLDASSTVLRLIQILPDVPLTIITNALQIFNELVDKSEYKVISLGGEFNRQSRSFVGPMGEHALEYYRVNKYFLSCRGVDISRGLSEAADVQARFKKRLIDLSDETYLLADCSKIGIRSSYFFAKLQDIDAIVTDSGIEAETQRELEQAGLRVEIAK